MNETTTLSRGNLDQLAFEMIAWDREDPKRIQHFLKVHALCRLIGLGEGLAPEELYILEAAAYVHDIGIRAAEQKYGTQNGKLQEELGPPLAEALLKKLGFADHVISRVCWLVGHHHTYTGISGLDYRILIEADWLVNNYEYGLTGRTIYASYDRIFVTETGKKLFTEIYGKP